MIQKLRMVIFVFSLMGITSISFADSHSASAVEKLSPDLRALLNTEMRALEDGMKAILPAYYSGDTGEIIHIAIKMRDSYILKQSLTPEQKQELKSKLPKSFIELDQKFHNYAGMLAHVAENKNHELIGFYYAKLTESCVGCHKKYAKHRFPKFSKKQAEEGHSH